MEQTITETNQKENYYHNSDLEIFLSKSKKTLEKHLLKKAALLAEVNDAHAFQLLYEHIAFLKVKTFSKPFLESLAMCCDKVINQNFLDISLLVPFFSILNQIFSCKRVKISLDWKVYYKIFFMLQGPSCYEFHYMKSNGGNYSKIFQFFTKSAKNFSVSDDDYGFLRNEVLNCLYSGNDGELVYGLKVLNSFIPVKYLANDEEMQNILFKILINKSNYVAMVLALFRKIVMNGTLKVDANEFITNFFNIMNNYITQGLSLGMGFTRFKKKEKKNQRFESQAYSYLMAAVIFHPLFEPMREEVDRHFQVLLSFINLNLKENSSTDVIKTNLSFLKNIVQEFKKIVLEKNKIEISDMDVEKDYLPIQSSQISLRMEKVMTFLEPLIVKSLLYEDKISCNLIEQVFQVTFQLKISKGVFETLLYLLENSDVNFSCFISKVCSCLKALIELNNYGSSKEIVQFLKKAIELSIDNISSVSAKLTNVIILFLSQLYLICNDYKKNDKYSSLDSYKSLFQLLNSSSVIICKKFIPLLEFLSNVKKNKQFRHLLQAMLVYVDETKLNEITDLFFKYPMENELGPSWINFYFKCLSDMSCDKHKLIWDFCYNSLIKETNAGSVGNIPKFCLFNDNLKYDIDIANAEKLKYFKQLLFNLKFSSIPSTSILKTQVYVLITALLKQNDYQYHQIAFNLLDNLITNKLSIEVDYKIKYPNKEDIQLVLELYQNIILPYYTYLKLTIDDLMNKLQTHTSASLKEKKKIAKKMTNESLDVNTLIKIALIFIKFANPIVSQIENPFTVLCDYSGIAKKFDISNSSFQEEHKLYQEFRGIKTRLVELENSIIEFSSTFGVLNGTNIQKALLKNTVSQFSDSSFHLLTEANQNEKFLKKALRGLNKKENVLVHKQKMISTALTHIRVFKLCRDSSSFNLMNVRIVAKLCMNSTEGKLTAQIPGMLKQAILFSSNKKSDMKLVYQDVYKLFTKSLMKIKVENSNILNTDKTKVSSILKFFGIFGNLIRMAQNTNPVVILDNYIQLLKLATEKKFSDLTVLSQIIFGELSQIKHDVPRSNYLIEKKLKCFPHIAGLIHQEIPMKNNDVRIVAEKLIKNKTKIEKTKIKIKEHIRTSLLKFYNNLSKGTLTEVAMCNYMLTMNIVATLIACLDISTAEDYKIISQYEQYFYQDLLAVDSPYIQKNLSYFCLGLILRLKHKNSKVYTIQTLTKEEYDKCRADVLKNTKGTTGLNENTLHYLKTVEYSTNTQEIFDQVNLPIIKSLANEDDFERLVLSLMKLKDVLNDQSLMQSGVIQLISQHTSFSSQSLDFLHLQNPQNKSQQIPTFFGESSLTKNLFDNWDSSLIYHLFHLYCKTLTDCFTYDKIIALFDKLIAQSTNEHVVTLSIYLHVLSGMIRSDICEKHFEEVKKYILKPMDYFTNGTNKRIDGDILNYFSCIIDKMTICQFENIFYDDLSSQNPDVKFLKLDPDFALKAVTIISKAFNLKSLYAFQKNPQLVVYIEDLITSYLTNNVNLVKNLAPLKTCLSSLFLISGRKYYNFRDFIYDYGDHTEEYLRKVLEICTKSDLKENKQICAYLVFNYKKFFIEKSELLMQYLVEIAKMTYLDLDDFDKYLDSLRRTFQFPCYNLNLTEYLTAFEASIPKLDNIHSRKFFVDLITNLFKSNISSYQTHFKHGLMSIMRMINNSQYEIKEYIVNHFFIYFLHAMNKEEQKKILACLKEIISNHQSTEMMLQNYAHLKEDISNAVSIIFVFSAFLKPFDLEVPEHIQDLLISMKSYNNKLFKNKGQESKLIKGLVAEFFNKYKYTFNFAKRTMSVNCQEAINDLSRTTSYFM